GTELYFFLQPDGHLPPLAEWRGRHRFPVRLESSIRKYESIRSRPGTTTTTHRTLLGWRLDYTARVESGRRPAEFISEYGRRQRHDSRECRIPVSIKSTNQEPWWSFVL